MHMCTHSHIAEIRKVAAREWTFVLVNRKCLSSYLSLEETARLRAGGQVKLQIASG